MNCMHCIEISIEEVTSISADISVEGEITADINVIGDASPKTQEKSITPANETQTILPDDGYLLSSVTVGPIPENYGLITYNGYSIMVS